MIFAIDSRTTAFTLPAVPRTQEGRASWIASAVAVVEQTERLPGRARVWFETGDADADLPLIGLDVASALLVAGLTDAIDQMAGRFNSGAPADQIIIAVRPLAERAISAEGRKRIGDAQRRRWAKVRAISAEAA
jgi:hypothetical protein